MEQKSPDATTRVEGAPYPLGRVLRPCGSLVAPLDVKQTPKIPINT